MERAGAARGRKKAKEGYEGIVPRLERLLESGEGIGEGDDDELDDDIAGSEDVGRYAVTRVCDVCKGKRLRPEALAVKIAEKNIADIGTMPLRAVRSLLEQIATPFMKTRLEVGLPMDAEALAAASTKDELMEEARNAGIDLRDSMTKTELAEALSEAMSGGS